MVDKKFSDLLEKLLDELDYSTSEKRKKIDLNPKEVDAEVMYAIKKAMSAHNMKTPEEYFKYLGAKIEESRKK